MNQKCDKCGKEFPQTTKFFKKYSHKTNGLNYHSTCKECEDKEKYKIEWKKDKLLCHICGEYLPQEEFQDTPDKYKYRNYKDVRCRCCKVEQNKLAKSNYSDFQKLKHILNTRLLGAKERCKKSGNIFNITLEFLLELWKKQKGLCAISKIPMTYEINAGRTYTNVSLDQIIPGKGYTQDNVQLICMAVNQAKADLSLEQFLFICKNVTENN